MTVSTESCGIQVKKVQIDGIPDSIKTLRRWVLWRREYRGGKPTKVPYSAQLGGGEERWPAARSNEPNTWATFLAVMRHVHHFDGIGFMLGGGYKIKNPTLDPKLKPKKITAKERAQLLAFLKSLAPEQKPFDRPQLP